MVKRTMSPSEGVAWVIRAHNKMPQMTYAPDGDHLLSVIVAFDPEPLYNLQHNWPLRPGVPDEPLLGCTLERFRVEIHDS